jgi:hypothetical protein
MGPSLIGGLGTPELLIILIGGVLVLLGLVAMLVLALDGLRKPRRDGANDEQRPGDGDS